MDSKYKIIILIVVIIILLILFKLFIKAVFGNKDDVKNYKVSLILQRNGYGLHDFEAVVSAKTKGDALRLASEKVLPDYFINRIKKIKRIK